MNNFVVSADFMNAACVDKDKLFNVIIVFMQDNPFKMVIDYAGENKEGKSESILLTKYKEIWIENDVTKTLFNYIIQAEIKESKIFYMYKGGIQSVDKKNIDELCIFLAGQTQRKQLITDSKEIFLRNHLNSIDNYNVTIIDGDEAKQQLNTHSTTINQTIIGLISSLKNLIHK
jgi:hypothetical protein